MSLRSDVLTRQNAAKVAKLAHKEHLSLKEACVKLSLLSPEEFDRYVIPSEMIHPKE